MSDLMDAVCDLTDKQRILLLAYIAGRRPDMVEAGLDAIRELELGQPA